MRGLIMSKENEEIVEERIYTIPLTKAWSVSIKKRTPRAMRVLKDFIKKHMKPEGLLISTEVNEFLWRRGIRGSPRKIRIKAVRNTDNVVIVYLVKGE
jgi:large subunit ribosomal protein L31e